MARRSRFPNNRFWSAFRPIPRRRRAGCPLDRRDKRAIELGDERGEVLDDLLPARCVADRVLPADRGSARDRERVDRLEPQPLDLEKPENKGEPRAGIEMDLDREITGGAAAQREAAAATAAVIAERGEGLRESRLQGPGDPTGWSGFDRLANVRQVMRQPRAIEGLVDPFAVVDHDLAHRGEALRRRMARIG